MIAKRTKLFFLMVTFLFFTCKTAYANVPIGAALMMTFPLMSMFVSWGLALLVAILFEGLVLKKSLELNYLQAFKASFLANAFSTLIGVGIAIAYSSSFAFLICWIPGTILLKRYFKILAEKSGYLLKFAKGKILPFVTFLGIGFIGMFLGALLLPWSHFGSGLYKGKIPEHNDFLIIPALIILLILGFIITVIIEGVIVARLFPEKQRKIVLAVLKMNFYSYVVLLLVTGASVLRIIFRN